ncbi:MAG TPA: fibronectin type III domain-containing protein [Pyrinomonadaceae bacterium]
MTTKIKLSLQQLSVPELIALAQQITGAMKSNPNFTTPNPPLATVTDATKALQTASDGVNAARMESKNKTIIQSQHEDNLKGLLRQLASYVDNISNGDEALITSAGMDVQAASTGRGELTVPTAFTATSGDSEGEIDLSWNPVPHAQSYVVESSPDAPPAAKWTHQLATTKSKATLTNLTSGTRYWFRAAAIGSQGQGGWSDISMKVAP